MTLPHQSPRLGATAQDPGPRPEPVPGRGRSSLDEEVNALMVALLMRPLRARGIPLGRLFHGLAFQPGDVPKLKPWIPWGDFNTFCDRCMHACGGQAGWEEVTGELVVQSAFLRLLAAASAHPQAFCVNVFERGTRQSYRSVGLRVEHLPDGWTRCQLTLPPDQAATDAFWVASVGCMRAYPRLFGHGSAPVEAQWTAHTFDARVLLPRHGRVFSRVKSSLAGVAARIQGRTPEEQDLFDHQLTMATAPHIHDLVAPLGQRLMVQPSMEALAQELEAVLRQHFLCRHVALWWTEPGAPRLVQVLPASPGSCAGTVMRTLQVFGAEVGRLQVDLPALAQGGSIPAFEALLPWIAAAVKGCQRTLAAPSNQTQETWPRVEAFRLGHALSKRQTQVLHMILEGAANKDIAAAHGTSVKTVEAHITALMLKTATSSRTELMARVWGSRPGH